jgi:hypothetical protein
MAELAKFIAKAGNMAELVKFIGKGGQTEGNLEKLGSSGTLWNKPGNAGQN